MRHTLAGKIAMTGAVAAMALGVAACEVDDTAVAPGQEAPADDPLMDDGTENDDL